jgi:two-component system sensor histidine kinase RegB
LASLATLASGAAHELSTPLSTIAVVAKELQRVPPAASDAALIRREVERCRDILQRMAADAGQSGDEAYAQVAVQVLLESAMDGLSDGERVSFEQDAASRHVAVHAQPQAMAQALRTLIKNALQASGEGAAVRVEAAMRGELCELSVHDRGAGMSADVLSRAGEPFFTTKEPGEGMGLGLFLTRVIVERGGGTLVLRSRVGEGTSAALTLPVRQSVAR